MSKAIEKLMRDPVREAAEDYVGKMNPTHWDGKGDAPSGFRAESCTYEPFKGQFVKVHMTYKNGWRTGVTPLDSTTKEPAASTRYYDGIDSVDTLAGLIGNVVSSDSAKKEALHDALCELLDEAPRITSGVSAIKIESKHAHPLTKEREVFMLVRETRALFTGDELSGNITMHQLYKNAPTIPALPMQLVATGTLVQVLDVADLLDPTIIQRITDAARNAYGKHD